MKKLRIFSTLIAITLTLTNFSGILPLLSDLFSITANAAEEKTAEEIMWTPSESDWIDDQISDPEDGYAYTFAVVGDTQTLLWYDLVTQSNNMGRMYSWIVQEAKNGKIDLVMGMGDISETNTGGKTDYPYIDGKFDFTKSKINYKFDNSTSTRKNEYLYAKSNIDRLAQNNIPYTIVRGNHDKPSSTATSEYTFDNYFKYEEYASNYSDGQVGRYDGIYADGSMHNTYLKIEVAGVKYMIVNLDCGVSSHQEKADDILEWANRVVAANKDHKVIVTTHMFLNSDGYKDPNTTKQPEYYGLYSGQTIWNKFARKHENISLIISGHHKTWDIGRGQTVGDNGNTVTQLMIDPQRIDMPKNYPDAAGHGGTGLVALLHFSKDGKTLDVEYYSTIRKKYFREQNQFSLDLTVLDNKTEYTDSNHTHIYSGDCDATCDLCLRATRTPSIGHTYYHSCDPDCNICNASRVASHTYTDDCDATCNNGCGTVRIPTHSFEKNDCTKCEFPIYEDFQYTVYNNEATVTKYKGTATSVSVPQSINGFPVAYIGTHAFENNNTITNITIPSNVKIIGNYAFFSCSKLTTVTINSNIITAVNSYAFYNCTKLKNINLPDSIYYIGDSTFYNCTSLVNITLPNNLTAIERYCFYGCTALKTVLLKNSVNMIRQHAFYGCTALTTINFPSSLTTIGRYAFCSCTMLSQITIPSSVKVIEQSAFYLYRLKNIWYEGTKEDQALIDINYTVHATNGTNNESLKNAKWNYSSCIANTIDHTHAFTSDCDTECNNCGQLRDVTAKHIFTDECDETCNTCNTQRTDAHKYDDACDDKCNTCNAERIPPHEFGGDCGSECAKCKITRKASINHTYDNACDEDCNVCGKKHVSSHTYSSECDEICNECLTKTREVNTKHTYISPCDNLCIHCRNIMRTDMHVYDNDYDADCNECGNTRTVAPKETEAIGADDQTDKSQSSNVIIILIVVLVVLAIGTGVGCWFFLSKKRKNAK